MNYLIVLVAFVATGLWCVDINAFNKELGKEGRINAKRGLVMALIVAAVCELIVLCDSVVLYESKTQSSGFFTLGLVIAVIAIIALIILQFLPIKEPDNENEAADTVEKAKRYWSSPINLLAIAVGISAGMAKAEGFDIRSLYGEGFKTFVSIVLTFVAPIGIVWICGKIRWRCFGLMGFPHKNNQNDDPEETETEGERTPNDSGALIKVLLPYVALLLGLVLIGIGTYAAVTFIKGGLM